MWTTLLKGIGKIGGGLLGLGGGADSNKIAQQVAGILGGAGAGIGAASQGAASNRGAQFEGQLGLERLLMDRDKQFYDMQLGREKEGRDGGTDAWRKLLAAQHTLSPGARPSLSPYSVGPRQATDMERQGADAMSQEVMARLQGGNPIAAPTQRPMSVDPSLLKAGTGEKVGGWLAPILTFLGQNQQPVSRTMSGVPKGGNYA